jgi:hypothetical protein
MPIKTEMWRIDKGLEKVSFSKMETEKKLESILEQDVTIIDPDLMVIGRQVPTSFGKYIDLLAIDSEGHLVILEVKKDKTPRDVVAQALDYSSWARTLSYEDIIGIYAEYDTTRDFETAFAERFGGNPPESINEDHRSLIVASELDNSSERIVNYLSSNYGVPINAVYFQYFKDGQGEYLSRTWLIDPVKAEVQTGKVSRAGGKEIWNGTDYYVSFGEGSSRNWEDAVKYGFVSAGGGKWYSNTLSLLYPGARIFVCIPKVGYVGVGIVKEESKRVNEFIVDMDGDQTPILKAPLKAPNMGGNADDPDLSEYLVKVEWINTKSVKNAVWEKGMFANQNSACKLRNKFTVERLTNIFELENVNSEVTEPQKIEYPVQIKAQHKGETYYAELVNIKGRVRFEKKEYTTPTTAAKVIVTDWKEVNGWDFWRYLNPGSGEWEKIGKLR